MPISKMRFELSSYVPHGSKADVKMTYRLTIGDIEEVISSYFLLMFFTLIMKTMINNEDDILKSRSSLWKWNNMILLLVIAMSRIEVALIKIYFDATNRFRNKDALYNSEADLKRNVYGYSLEPA
ncbi:hypothetical protein T01_10672 [Trichinella spiralis]|uniref:Uncharacterized protein n=1 Tax=Trichinella spiralis TaxID=6334 RepID=A0A0V1AQF6_TRISP|nr:hypothetical protein T01_10672 [Trichinella spiralis]